jgi:hypothetical protein
MSVKQYFTQEEMEAKNYVCCYGLRGIHGRFDSKIRFEIESEGRFDSRFDSNAKTRFAGP